jgi:hypothetical protein
VCCGEPVRSEVSFPGLGEVADAMLSHSLDPVADTTSRVAQHTAIKTSRLYSSLQIFKRQITKTIHIVGA